MQHEQIVLAPTVTIDSRADHEQVKELVVSARVNTTELAALVDRTVAVALAADRNVIAQRVEAVMHETQAFMCRRLRDLGIL